MVLAGLAALVSSSTATPDEKAAAKKALAEPSSKAAAPTPDARPALPTPTTIDASTRALLEDYKADAKRADGKYRNRVVVVTGVAAEVNTDSLGMGDSVPGNVLLKTMIGEIQANAGSAASSLKRGQQVTLRCMGRGYVEEIEMPVLVDCKVVTR